MTREEVEEAMGVSKPIQASFEVIGDDVKFIKLIINGKEKVVNIEELITTYTEPCRESDDYENEIADLYNRLDIAEYDKERLREEVTELEEKLKALSAEPCDDCISRKGVISQIEYVLSHPDSELRKGLEDTLRKAKTCISIQPKSKTGHWEQYGYSWEDKFKCSECGEEQPKILCGERIIGHWSDYCPNCGADMRGE